MIQLFLDFGALSLVWVDPSPCRNMSQHVATAQVEVVYKGFQPKYDSFSAMHHATSGCLSTYRMDDVVVMVSSLNSSGWWGCLV